MGKIDAIEMYAGVGGFRVGCEKASDKFNFVWANDIDKWATSVYKYRFGNGSIETGSITDIKADEIPSHDILTAGFPCQAFSLAGERKGFEDTRGTLFFEVCRVAEYHKPKILFLENVRGLLSNDKGLTFQVILQSLDELGYDVEWQLLNSKHWWIPQNRPRVFIIGHLRGTGGRQVLPLTADYRESIKPPEATRIPESRIWIANTLLARYYKDGKGNILGMPKEVVVQTAHIHPDRWGKWIKEQTFVDTLDAGGTIGAGEPVLVEQVTEHSKFDSEKSFPVILKPIYTDDEGNEVEYPYPVLVQGAFGYLEDKPRIYADIAPTILTGTGGGHIPYVCVGYRLRKLTPKECERLQAFPDDWTKYGIYQGKKREMSNTQRYKMMGNAVTTRVVEVLAKRIVERCF